MPYGKIQDGRYFVRLIRADGKPDEERRFRTKEEAKSNYDKAKAENSGLYRRIEFGYI